MLMATDLRTSKTAKIQKLYYYYITAHRRTSMCSSRVEWGKTPPVGNTIFSCMQCFRGIESCRVATNLSMKRLVHDLT